MNAPANLPDFVLMPLLDAPDRLRRIAHLCRDVLPRKANGGKCADALIPKMLVARFWHGL